MIQYRDSPEGVTEAALAGFFEGWPDPPSPATHLRLLRESGAIILAADTSTGAVVGFITAITDGILSAYIPLLEVRPDYRRQGIGAELVRRMLRRLDHLYMVDLICDEALVPFYRKLGMDRMPAMSVRNFAGGR